MSYADKKPIRESLLERVPPFIEQHKGGLTILEYDIQLQSFPMQGNLVNSYCFILTCLGALVGEANYLSYTFTFRQDPHPPNDRDLDIAVRETCSRLGLMKMRQLQQANPHSNN